MFLLHPGVWQDGAAAGAGVRVRSQVGWRILVPGWAQWSWRQPERAFVLFGSFVASLVMGAFAWGSWVSVVVLAFAFLTHVVSSVDVLRQAAFPGFGRWMPVISISGGLAVGIYGPLLGMTALVAWPVQQEGSAGDGYLVNCWAYRHRDPERGDCVWLRLSPWSEPKIGRVVAEAGDEVEWSKQRFRVNGTALDRGLPFRSHEPPDDLAYKVPEGHLLVLPDALNPRAESSRSLVLVANAQVHGRAWARLYPVWERGLLQ